MRVEPTSSYNQQGNVALRIFADRDRREWRAWDVQPSSSTGGLRADLRDGWICFERIEGGDRCRLPLSNAPPGWETLPDERLDLLHRVAAADSEAFVEAALTRSARAEEEAARLRKSGPRQMLGPDDQF